MKTVNEWIKAIGRPISVSRWGDGESLILQGAQGANCDGVEYTQELRNLLTQASLNPAVVKLTTRNRKWKFPFPSNGDHATLHDASERGQLRPFFQALRRHGRLTIVGPEHLKALPMQYRHVVTHPSNAIGQLSDILGQLEGIGPGDVVLFCAGPTSNILIDRLHGRGACLLDVGALLDPYAGVISRIHQRRAGVDVRQMSPIILSLATQPHRAKYAQQVVEHFESRSYIRPDAIRITLNGFTDAPAWALPHEHLVTDNLGAKAKFRGIEDHPGTYWLTVDDDIQYPRDYIPRLLAAHRQHGGAVGVHAGIPPPEGPYWSPKTKKIHFEMPCQVDTKVTLLGTGTLCIRTDDFPDLSMGTFEGNENRTDPVFAVYCRKRGIRMTTVRRTAVWLKSYVGSQGSGKEVWRTMVKSGEVYDKIWTEA